MHQSWFSGTRHVETVRISARDTPEAAWPEKMNHTVTGRNLKTNCHSGAPTIHDEIK
jgi:hypothetical protein